MPATDVTPCGSAKCLRVPRKRIWVLLFFSITVASGRQRSTPFAPRLAFEALLLAVAVAAAAAVVVVVPAVRQRPVAVWRRWCSGGIVGSGAGGGAAAGCDRAEHSDLLGISEAVGTLFAFRPYASVIDQNSLKDVSDTAGPRADCTRQQVV